MRLPVDPLGLLLLAALGGGAVAAGLLLVDGWILSASGAGLLLLVGAAFVAHGPSHQGARSSINTHAHGAARIASEAEARAAATGSTRSAALHKQTFED
jgi:hypothetical protein